MTAVLTFNPEMSLGLKMRNRRVSLLLTQQELANIVGISEEQVDLFENSLPLPLEAKCKLLRELWARKVSK